MMTLAQQTRIAVQIIVEDDTGELAYLIAFATGLLPLLTAALRAAAHLAGWINDLLAAIDFTAKVIVIGCKAIGFGLGLTL